MRGCAVSMRYIDVCNCDVFSVVYVYHDHLKFCVVCIMVDDMSVVVNVMLPLPSVMSPRPALCNISVHIVVTFCIFGVFALGVSLVPFNCVCCEKTSLSSSSLILILFMLTCSMMRFI